jgi:hypothetical protein
MHDASLYQTFKLIVPASSKTPRQYIELFIDCNAQPEAAWKYAFRLRQPYCLVYASRLMGRAARAISKCKYTCSIEGFKLILSPSQRDSPCILGICIKHACRCQMGSSLFWCSEEEFNGTFHLNTKSPSKIRSPFRYGWSIYWLSAHVPSTRSLRKLLDGPDRPRFRYESPGLAFCVVCKARFVLCTHANRVPYLPRFHLYFH